MITAPYNFVPLNEEVFYPDWADDVNHDVPFEDGESGEIEVTITAKSPIFVRDSKDEEKFCNYNGQYYIPGSSVKGMVRNVLEIMSFSKMREEIFNDNTYAVRDLSSAKNFYMQEMNQHNNTTYCGWLIRKKIEDGKYKYFIEDCGIPGRIHHEQIDQALDVEFAKYFKQNNFDSSDQDQKSSEYKYNLVNRIIQTIKVGDKYRSKTNPKYDLREFYSYDPNGKKEAKLVLTGQPTSRQNTGEKGDGKGFEFLFFEPKRELQVTKEVFENFKFAYFDGRDTEPKESPDWTYWKKKLQNGEKVPVFFQKNGNTVKHFGLSYLYKLPYTHSIIDGIHASHFDSRADLVQTIFGYIDKENNQALKGRVQFSHFKASNATELQPRTEILGTPRASYYPIYIRQYDGKLYKTYMDSNFEIAGWKRYPIHRSNKVQQTQDTGNENVGTTFTPLKEGVLFKGKLRYHNLKKAELGALLSALTFHNTNGYYHNMGLAKSLGYGKVAINVAGFENIQEYLKAFEVEINSQIENWAQTPQLKELLSMAAEQNNTGNSQLRYMKLDEFAKNKKEEEYLRNYTVLDNIVSIVPKSLITDEELQYAKVKKEEFKRKQKELEQARKLAQKEKNDYEVVKSATDENQLKSFLEKYPNSKFKEEIEQKLQEVLAEKNKQKEDKFKQINENAQKAFDEVLKKKSNQKQFKKLLEKFIKKWEAKKNHKDSPFVLDLVQKATTML